MGLLQRSPGGERDVSEGGSSSGPSSLGIMLGAGTEVWGAVRLAGRECSWNRGALRDPSPQPSSQPDHLPKIALGERASA